MPDPNASNPCSLATLAADGKAPKSRLTDAKDGMELFNRLKRSAEPRLSRAAVIQGMRDGNAPFDPSRLRNRNEAWRSNYSTQEGSSRVDAAKTPFYQLVTSADLLADCGTDMDGQQVDAATASRIRSEEFSTMLRTYEDFEDEWWVMFDDMITFNRGFFWMPEPDSWRFEQIAWDRVYFPDGTSVKRRKWNFFAIEHSWTVHELWRMAKAGGKESGWNMEAVHDAIRNAMPESVARTDDPMAVQHALANQELFASECSQVVRAASLYVQEFDGSWSRMVVGLDGNRNANDTAPKGPVSAVEQSVQGEGAPRATPDGKPKPNKTWLYRKEKIAQRVTQILVPFFYETTNGTVNAIKGGLGSRILPIMQATDRMACALTDNTLLRSSIVLQPQNASSRAKSALMQVGPITVLPEGFLVQQGTLFGDLEGSIAVRDHLSRTVDSTTGTFRPAWEKPRGNPETATAAQMRFAQSAQLSDSAVERFYKRADTFYYEIYERASDTSLPDSTDPFIAAARAFQKRCLMRGLSAEQIRDCSKAKVRASRSIGNGSPAMRQQALGAVGGLALQGLLGPRGLQEWKRLFVAAHLGQAGVEALLPKDDIAEVPTRDDWDASQENADMNQGNQAVFAPWQNSGIHALSHIQAGYRAVQAVQQGADPAIPFTFLTVALPHIEQHIGAVPIESLRKQLTTMFGELEKGAKIVEQAAQEQMKGQQQQQALNFEQQRAMQETQGKLALSREKAVGTLQLKKERQDAEIQLQARQQMMQSGLQDADTAAAIRRQTAQTAATIADQQRKTEAEIENQRRKAEAAAKEPVSKE
jgi:hypothetical protein